MGKESNGVSNQYRPSHSSEFVIIGRENVDEMCTQSGSKEHHPRSLVVPGAAGGPPSSI